MGLSKLASSSFIPMPVMCFLWRAVRVCLCMISMVLCTCQISAVASWTHLLYRACCIYYICWLYWFSQLHSTFHRNIRPTPRRLHPVCLYFTLPHHPSRRYQRPCDKVRLLDPRLDQRLLVPSRRHLLHLLHLLLRRWLWCSSCGHILVFHCRGRVQRSRCDRHFAADRCRWCRHF